MSASGPTLSPSGVGDYRDGFLELLQRKRRSARSIGGSATDLDQFAEFTSGRSVQSLTTQDVVAFLKWLEQQHDRKPNTIRRKLVTVRRFFQFLVETAVLDSNPAAPITIPSSPGGGAPPLSKLQCRRLVAAAEFDPQWLAIVLLILTTGIKREEALALRWEDVEWRRDGAAGRMTVRGSGRRAVRLRTLSLPRRTGRALGALARTIDADGPPKGLIFNLSARGFDHAVRRCGELAGMSAPLTARLLRDTFAVHLLGWLSAEERRQARVLSRRGQNQLRRGFEAGFLSILGVGRNAALIARYRAALLQSQETDGTESFFLRHGDFATTDEL